MIEVILPDALVKAAKLNNKAFYAEGNTLNDVVKSICSENCALQTHLFHQNGQIKEHFLLTSDGAQVTPEQTLPADAKVNILLASAGGMGSPLNQADIEELSNEEVKRYVRHITLPGVGRDGQAKLKNARVLIIGAGGLGSPVSLYLAAAGVGTIGLVDFDLVELSNLQRQIVHGSKTIGMSKVESAKSRLMDLNPDITVNTHQVRLGEDNALELISEYDLVVDGTDNFNSRYLVNDVCSMLQKPLVFGAIYRFDGQVSVLNYKNGPCYRCLFPTSPPPELAPNCSSGGVIGVLPGIIGVIQATEAIKVIIELGDVLSGRLLVMDALSMRFNEVSYAKRDDCPDCSSNRKTIRHTEEAAQCIVESIASESSLPKDFYISPKELETKIDQYLLVDVRDPNELEVCALPGVVNIPLNDISLKLAQMHGSQNKCIVCYSGVRAKSAAEELINAGVENVCVLAGGMKRWVREVEPSMPIY